MTFQTPSGTGDDILVAPFANYAHRSPCGVIYIFTAGDRRSIHERRAENETELPSIASIAGPQLGCIGNNRNAITYVRRPALAQLPAAARAGFSERIFPIRIVNYSRARVGFPSSCRLELRPCIFDGICSRRGCGPRVMMLLRNRCRGRRDAFSVRFLPYFRDGSRTGAGSLRPPAVSSRYERTGGNAETNQVARATLVVFRRYLRNASANRKNAPGEKCSQMNGRQVLLETFSRIPRRSATAARRIRKGPVEKLDFRSSTGSFFPARPLC